METVLHTQYRLGGAARRAWVAEAGANVGQVTTHRLGTRAVGQERYGLAGHGGRRKGVLNELGHDGPARDEVHHAVGGHTHERPADLVGHRRQAVHDHHRTAVSAACTVAVPDAVTTASEAASTSSV